MNTPFLLQCALRVAVTFALCGPAVAQEASGTRRALLIGINDYAHVPALRGCVNDTELVANLLRSRYAFTDVRLLHNAAASRTGILAALRRIVADTGPDDVLHVHYSGHGSQVLDGSGDEKDGFDETLVPCDGRDAAGKVADILDDELEEIFSACRTPHLALVFDSCHSGTIERDTGAIRTRAVARDTRAMPEYAVRSRMVTDSSKGFPVVSSARASQKALDGPVDGNHYGLFTAALVRALSHAPFDRSIRAVHRAAGEEYGDIVTALGVTHMASTPVLAVTKARGAKPLIPPPARGARLRSLPVAQSGEVIRLAGGANAGAAIGSVWAIHPARAADFAPGQGIAVARVVEHVGGDADLELLRFDPQRRAAMDGCRAVLVAASSGASTSSAAATRVKIAGGDNRGRAALQRQLQDLVRGVRFVSQHADAQLVVQILPDGSRRLLAADERTELARLPRATDARETASVLSRSLSTSELLALENLSTALDLRVWLDRNDGVEQPEAESVDDGFGFRDIDILATGGQSTRYRVFRDGDTPDDSNCFLVNVQVDQRAYVTIVNVDAAGNVRQLFPNSVSERSGYYPDGLVEDGQALRVPDEIVAQGNRAGFVLPYRTPGQEVVRVFASSDLETAQRMRAAFRSIEDATRDLGAGSFDALDAQRAILDELRLQLFGTVTRGIGIKGVEVVSNRPRRQHAAEASAQESESEFSDAPVGDWAAASVTVEVEDR